MAKLPSEGNVKVHYLPAVANKAAPTVAEINAGTNLTPFLPTAGVGVEWTQNNTSTPMLDESFTTEAVGTESASVSLTFLRHRADGDDSAWNLFVRGTDAFLLISRKGAPAVGSKVEVYPIQCHRPVPLPPATNEDQQARVSLAVRDTPDLRATVA